MIGHLTSNSDKRMGECKVEGTVCLPRLRGVLLHGGGGLLREL